jgi:integrase
VRANREIAWFSAAWNWARENGRTRAQNPAQGVKKNKEKGRNVYIEDDELAYLIGQRPCDLRGIRETDIRNDSIVIEQDKTGAKQRFEIVGDLKALLDRIKRRKAGITGVHSLMLICDEKGRPFSKSMMRGRFDRAREKAARAAPTSEQAARIRALQFRDLRAKAASDVENLERAQAVNGAHKSNHDGALCTQSEG